MRVTSLALGASLAIAAGTVSQSKADKTAGRGLSHDTTTNASAVRRDLPVRSSGADLITAFLGKPLSATDSTTLDVIIVSIPDPISSHLDWSYDAQLESVRRAFERNGYLVDRFWLPWRQPLDSVAVSLATAEALPGARVPGVILFRKSTGVHPDLRLVYVVGEVPTLGIHKPALREALNERARLLAQAGMPDTVIRIVGPAFSGSSRSMRLAIDGWRDSTKSTTPVRIVTGAASDFGNLAMLTGPRLSFTSTVHTSARLLDAALALLVDKLEIKKSEVAFLIEGSTQYGAGAQQVKDSTDNEQRGDTADVPLSVSFPLSISSLRAQYARHPEDQLALSKSDAAAAKTAPRLPLDTREPASLTESPRNLSQLTPSATEIMFLQLERTLLSHRIRAVAILATDIRDQLFLASELRKRLPDLQLVFIGSNSLLLRAEYAEALVGSFVISTYPLFAENQFWDLTKNDNERVAFMSDESEGTFNALLHQLGADSAMAEYISPMLHDSIARARRPPVWYTVIGRDAVYPLALDNTSPKSAVQDSIYMFSRLAEGKRSETERFPWRNEFFIALAALGLGFVVAVALLQFRTATRVDAALVSPFGSDALREGNASGRATDGTGRRVAEATSLLLHRELYVFLRYVALFGAFSAAMLLVLRPSAHGIALSKFALLLCALVALALSVLMLIRVLSQTLDISHLGRAHNVSLLAAGRSPRRHTLLWKIEKVARFAMLLMGLGYLMLILLFLAQVLHLDARESTFFFHRAVALAGGVSSAVPIVLASLGFVTWCSWHLVRIELLSEPTVYEHFLLHSAAAEAWLAEARIRVRAIERDIKHGFNAAAGWARSAVDTVPDGHAAPGDATAVAANETRAFLMRAEALSYHVEQLAIDAQVTVARAIGAIDKPTAEQQAVISQHTRETERVRQRCRDTLARARDLCGVTAATIGAGVESQGGGTGGAKMNVGNSARARSSSGAFYERRREPRLTATSGWRRWMRVGMDWLDDRDRDKWLDRRSMSAAQKVRDALLYLIPSFGALGMLAGLCVLGIWLSTHFELTMESLVLTTHWWLSGMSSFDVLFRFTVIASIGATTWAIYRFVTVWSGIRAVLDDIDPVLHPGFVKLPPKLARITRLTPFGETSRHEIEREVEDQWVELNCIEVSAALRLPATIVAPPMPRSRPYEIDESAQQLFGTLHDRMQECKAKRLLSEHAPAKDAEMSPDQQWAAKLAALYAVYVADYIDWVFQHLRYLASFMMIAMVLTSILLASYSFHPQSVFRILMLLIMGVAVLVIVSAVVQINRHPVLRAITNPATGPSGWNPQLMSNLITYVLVPLITVASTQLPQVREFLFSWVTPLLRAFVKN
ncbi:MAG: hypothetical protein M3Z05_07430 [Gemmatimonadota bacterium]|nr:hypothetical protein [Gemmatimonadota bacterium]